MDAALMGSQLFAGVVSGMILVLLAIGLSLIFGMMQVINFAHGALYMVGAYMTYLVVARTAQFWPVIILVPAAVAALAWLIERLTIRPLYGRPEEDPLLLTFGLGLVLVETIRLVFGKIGLPVNIPEGLRGTVQVGLFSFPLYLIFVVATAAAMLLLLWWLLEYTSTGLVVRAGTRDPEVVQVLGLDLNRARSLVFVVGVVMAGLGGALSAPLRGVIPEMGEIVLPQSFVVVVIGGMGSYWGTVVSGLLVGITVAMTSLFAPEWSDVAMYLLMAAVLLIKPEGLFARGGRGAARRRRLDAGSSGDGSSPTEFVRA